MLALTGRIPFYSRYPAMLGVRITINAWVNILNLFRMLQIAVSTIKYLVELCGWNGIALQAVHSRDAKIYINDPGSWILGLVTEAQYSHTQRSAAHWRAIHPQTAAQLWTGAPCLCTCSPLMAPPPSHPQNGHPQLEAATMQQHMAERRCHGLIAPSQHLLAPPPPFSSSQVAIVTTTHYHTRDTLTSRHIFA